jgi:hypothetical protein
MCRAAHGSKRGNGYGSENRVNILKKVKVGKNWNLYPAVVEPNGNSATRSVCAAKWNSIPRGTTTSSGGKTEENARSPCCLHHGQQSPHMFRFKSSPNHQAPAVLQPDFGPRVAGKLAEHSATCTSTNLAIHETTRPTKHLLFSDSRGFGRNLGEEGQQLSEGFFSHWFLFTRH